jgi:16S rRNA (uracil1498-N3)-methyltransferase
MPRFFYATNLAINQDISVPNNILQHILVLRLHVNEQIMLFNGDSYQYCATIIELSRKQCKLKIINKQIGIVQSPISIELLMCIIASDQMNNVIKKAVELGIKTITPIVSDFSQRIVRDRIVGRLEHWEKIIISSCEQCGRNYIPTINSPITFTEMLATKDDTDKFILSPYSDSLMNAPTNSARSLSAKILIGPEGGFSEQELMQATQANFIPLKLGDVIMCSDTAVIAGITYLNILYNNWNNYAR